MMRNQLFIPKQYGFISWRSTTLQLLRVLDLWPHVLDMGDQVDAIFMDYMKAFDQLPHRRLLRKVESYGISSNILGWIEVFMFDRSQYVLVNGSKSSWDGVTGEITQGSF